MRRTLCLLGLLAFTLPAGAGEPPRYKIGETFSQEVVVSRRSAFRVLGIDVVKGAQYAFASSLAITKVNKDGSLEATQTIKTAKLIDADADLRASLAAALAKTEGVKFDMTVAANGEVTQLKGLKDSIQVWIGKDEDVGASLRMWSVLDADAWKELGSRTFFVPERPLRETLRVPYGVQRLTLTVEQSREIVHQARRRSRTHNGGRKHVEQMLFERLAASSRDEDDTPEIVRDRTRREPEVIEALEWMWPVLTPAELLNDLMGSRALMRSAAKRHLSTEEWTLLLRPRRPDPTEIVFTSNDVPLLDEALEALGPRPRHKDADAVRTYGHIVVDEAQDLTPMELRVLDRRSLNGSMTIVGDIAQATGAWPHDDWESVLSHLPERRPPRRAAPVFLPPRRRPRNGRIPAARRRHSRRAARRR